MAKTQTEAGVDDRSGLCRFAPGYHGSRVQRLRVVYVTTSLNAKRFHKQELARLYKERWKIELDIRAIKTHMGMEMSLKIPEMVQKEIAVHLLAYNIIRGNLAQAAVLHDKIPRQLSFRSSVQLVCQATKR